jgi:peptidoglycan/LPS O-acetylase OafA/YrhL
MSTDSPDRESRFAYVPALDGLRAVAVLAVIVFHLRPARLPGGFTGVDIFFVISGFVVTSSLRGLEFSRLGELLRYFYARRVIRIVPALAAMLTVTALLVVLFIPSAGVMTASKQTGLAAASGVSNIFLILSRVVYFGTSADYNPYLHTWTLGVEEQFYLLFPFLYYLGHWEVRGRRWGVAIVAASSVASLLISARLSRLVQQFDFYLMPPRFWELGVGMLLALTFDTWRPRAAAAGSGTALSGFVLSFAAIGCAFAISFGGWFPFPGALLPVAGTAGLIVLACSRPGAFPVRALSHPVAVYLGKISYSLYLWHWPTFVLFRWTFGLNSRLEAVAALLITFLAANASYYFLERPLRRSPRVAAMPRLRIVAAGVGTMLGAAGAILLFFMLERQLTLTHGHPTMFGYVSRKPAKGDCPVTDTSRPFEGGVTRSWIPQCGSAPYPGKLVVIGDSHALAYWGLLERYASEARVPVYLYYKFSCGFPRLTLANSTQRQCAGFARAALRELKRDLSANDVLFMPALRLLRFETHLKPPSVDGAAAGYAEAFAQLTELSSTKATLVLEAPKPVFRHSVYRCRAWFNRNNPECVGGFETTRAEMQTLRGPMMASMERLAREVPGVVIWDPLPVLCPGDPCSALKDGQPLYFDDDHISGYANDVLFASFRDFIASAGAARPSRVSPSEQPAGGALP